MTATVYLHVDGTDAAPHAKILQHDNGERFITADFGDLSLLFCATDAECSAQVHALAETLAKTAAHLDLMLTADRDQAVRA